MRRGKEYVEALDDGRVIALDGEVVSDVARHPAFAGVVGSVARLYDVAADEAGMQIPADWGGGPINRVHLLPRDRFQLRDRREAIERWARLSHGFLGRSPDHVGGMFAAFELASEVFGRGGQHFADNVVAFRRRLAMEDLYVTYTIIPPQDDRSRAGREHVEPKQVRVVAERDGGIVLRGAQMLGTGSAIADYVFVACLQPLKPGDEEFAISCVVPCGAPGLRWFTRRPYALGKPSHFDYPLSTRFDETDSLAIFDDVFVPWEHVFVYRDVRLSRAQFDETHARVLGNSQAQVRLAVKVQFLIALAHRICELNGVVQFPAVQEKLGELAAWASVVEGMVYAAEATAIEVADAVLPNPRFTFSAMALQSDLYPRVLHLIRDLAGGGMIQVPSSVEDLTSEVTATHVSRYFSSPSAPASDRIKLFKLAWDAVSSEFAGRHHQYEMFYAGPPFVLKMLAAQKYGYEGPLAHLGDFLARYGTTEEVMEP